MTQSPEAQFAVFVATLGRGPGRSRALTREEAHTAFGMVLRGEADPHQVGAFLMLLRFRGEDADEITGMVEAARTHAVLGWDDAGAALDWPSYGAGRTRGAPWFLLAALALARSGIAVLMHGSNDFSAGIAVEDGLAALGAATGDRSGLRPGLRCGPTASPICRCASWRRSWTGCWTCAGCSVCAPRSTPPPGCSTRRMRRSASMACSTRRISTCIWGSRNGCDRRRLLVLKGGGGEAERVPLKPATASSGIVHTGRQELALPAVEGLRPLAPANDTAAGFAAVWRGDSAPETPLATIRATIALALLAMGRADDADQAMQDAASIWAQRL